MTIKLNLIEVDDALLAQAVELLGTRTKKDTVNRALSEYVKFRLRVSFGERLASGALPDLADPEIMARAWQ
ncbi:MAG: type II toxin-antitoxin system VapB family antitoxin [Pseudonocardiaceae bacterium]